jgi:hypothetical protein
MRKKRDKKGSNNIKGNKKNNESMIERTNFQIISSKDNKDSQKENQNLINIRNKIFDLDFSAIKRKDKNKEEYNNNIINEIKVKKANKYFIEINPNLNNFEINKNKIPKYKYIDNNKNSKDNNTDVEKYNIIRDTNKKKLLIINQLINNKRKSLNPNVIFNRVNKDNNRIISRGLSAKKEEYININKSYGFGNKIESKKPDFIEKKAKEIFFMENSEKKVTMHKNDNNNGNSNKSYDDNVSGKNNFRLKHNEIVTIDKIKRNKKYNLNINDDKVNEYNNNPKIQRKKEIMNY